MASAGARSGNNLHQRPIVRPKSKSAPRKTSCERKLISRTWKYLLESASQNCSHLTPSPLLFIIWTVKALRNICYSHLCVSPDRQLILHLSGRNRVVECAIQRRTVQSTHSTAPAAAPCTTPTPPTTQTSILHPPSQTSSHRRRTSSTTVEYFSSRAYTPHVAANPAISVL